MPWPVANAPVLGRPDAIVPLYCVSELLVPLSIDPASTVVAKAARGASAPHAINPIEVSCAARARKPQDTPKRTIPVTDAWEPPKSSLRLHALNQHSVVMSPQGSSFAPHTPRACCGAQYLQVCFSPQEHLLEISKLIFTRLRCALICDTRSCVTFTQNCVSQICTEMTRIREENHNANDQPRDMQLLVCVL